MEQQDETPTPPVLLVDDDEDYLDYMREVLERMGRRPVLAASAKAALSTLGSGRFSVVVADLRLPGSSGLEVLAAARRADPVSVGVIMTAHGTAESALEAIGQGVFDYLLKPCPVDVAQASLRRALGHYELRRSLVRKTVQIETLRRRHQGAVRALEDVSHRLKTSLSVVYGCASLLLERPAAEYRTDEVRMMLDYIHRSAGAMKDVLEQVPEPKS